MPVLLVVLQNSQWDPHADDGQQRQAVAHEAVVGDDGVAHHRGVEGVAGAGSPVFCGTRGVVPGGGKCDVSEKVSYL